MERLDSCIGRFQSLRVSLNEFSVQELGGNVSISRDGSCVSKNQEEIDRRISQTTSGMLITVITAATNQFDNLKVEIDLISTEIKTNITTLNVSKIKREGVESRKEYNIRIGSIQQDSKKVITRISQRITQLVEKFQFVLTNKELIERRILVAATATHENTLMRKR